MKRILLIGTLAATLGNGNAQPLRFVGAKIAYTSADQVFAYSNLEVPRNRRNGINLAVFAQWFDGESISLVTQLEYAQRGMGMRVVTYTPSPPDPGIPTVEYNRVDYLSIPILVKVYAFNGPIRPYVLGGFRFDIMLKHFSDFYIFDSVYEKFSKTTYGLSFGAGIQLDMLPVMLEARYNFDLKDSYNTQYLRVRNNSIDVWLGIAFRT